MFQEFQLSVTPLDQDRYLVRTEKVAPGVPLAEEQISWSVEEWLEEAQQLMNDPLLQVFQGEGVVGGNDGKNLPPSPIALGQKLYDALFQGSLRDSWIAAQGIANHQRALLRLRLGLKGSLLPRLPWEVLHTGGRESFGSRPLATGTDIAFSRYQPNLPVSLKVLHQGPVKILMVLAGPDDREGLDLQQEAEDLKAELSGSSEPGDFAIDLTILPHPGREELTQALEQGQYQVFHYAGHSNCGDSGGDIYLVNRYTGLTETLSGEDLAGLLANNGVQLAVFNSCRGADTARADRTATEGDSAESRSTERNLAQALIKCGIPAVLAMAERIPDEVAKTLTRLFYRNLDRGYPIDLSLSRARQGLVAAYGSDRLYWALPVLYLHPRFDGMLVEGERGVTLADELLELSEVDEIPLEVLAGDARFQEHGEFAEAEDLEFLAPLPVAQSEAFLAEENADDEDFVRGLMQEFAPVPTETALAAAPPDPPPPPIATFTPVAPVAPPPRSSGRFLPILGTIAAGAIAFAGAWWFFGRNLAPPTAQNRPPAVQPLNASPRTGNLDFASVQTDTLTGIAAEQFARGNFEQGQLAIAQLLDPQRNALDSAKAALAAIPREQQDRPEILFLSGRLAWQFALRGDKDYSIDDARRYWEAAARNDPKSIAYHNALGFAYYEEGKLANANKAWSDALELGSQQSIAQNKEILTTYAGLALALRQMSRQQTGNQQKLLLNKALKLRQVAISEAPAEFQTGALSKNWLWSEKAIKDWEGLIATKAN